MKWVNILLVMALAFFSEGCLQQESSAMQEDPADARPLPLYPAVGNFLVALKNKDKSRLVSVVRDSGVFVVRDFAGGNDGVQDESLYRLFSARDITDRLDIPVADQMPVTFLGLFPEASDQNFAKITVYPAELPALLPNEANATLWLQKLKEELRPRFESDQGIPVLLVSADNHLVVLCEAQIIGDRLVGSFAVFVQHTQHSGLGSLIDLL